MKNRVRSLLPSRERLHGMRWLRWLAPYLNHPRLWHLNRKGLALGVALGVFFGLLIPIAQIPVSATLAVLLRANVPAAVVSTLVTNPVTYGPVYFGAYKLGKWVLQTSHDDIVDTEQGAIIMPAPGSDTAAADTTSARSRSWWERLVGFWHWAANVGKPLVVGLAIVASVTGVLVYLLVDALWVLKVRRARRRRQRQHRPG